MNELWNVANVIAIKEEKVLIVQKRDFWILPGGKINKGESIGKCLLRELGEELPKSNVFGAFVYFGRFVGKSPSGKDIKVVACFGKIEGDITPAAEISDARWASMSDILFVHKNSLTDVTARIIWKLHCMKKI